MRVFWRTIVLLFCFALAGCVASYSLVSAGTVSVGGLQVSPGQNWNLAPATSSPRSRRDSQVWTQDGLLLDRLMIIPGVPDGEGIVVEVRETDAVPLFSADMLPNEIEELTESSIVKQFGEGSASVATSNLRPHRFGEHRGILFNMDVSVSGGPDYRGLVGSFIADDHLYMLIFLAAEPYYYDKHLAEAESIISNARLAPAPAG